MRIGSVDLVACVCSLFCFYTQSASKWSAPEGLALSDWLSVSRHTTSLDVTVGKTLQEECASSLILSHGTEAKHALQNGCLLLPGLSTCSLLH